MAQRIIVRECSLPVGAAKIGQTTVAIVKQILDLCSGCIIRLVDYGLRYGQRSLIDDIMHISANLDCICARVQNVCLFAGHIIGG
ncbi:hypothetical protein SDC9_104530 [bioreactor metagenome]|uniref:Uncharacterized protein n=1 Tax=bioreactor metagenome TaxID=1076179 RepID=A0A645AX34_9ZZZZ